MERLTGYYIGDELGVLSLDCYHGHIRYDKSIYINIEDLARKGEGNCLERFFDVLTTACYRHKFGKDVKTELIAKKLL